LNVYVGCGNIATIDPENFGNSYVGVG